MNTTLYHSLTSNATIMVSHKWPIISKHVVIILVTEHVTIATTQPVKKPLLSALSAYNSKTSSVTPIFNYRIIIVISMIRCNILQSLKKCMESVQSPLNFSKIEGIKELR